MARKIPKLLGLALTGLLRAHGWTAKELAVKAGVSQSAMSAYESGDITRERLEELAALMKLGPAEVERAVFAASLLLPPPPPKSPVDPTAEEWRVIQRAAAMAGSLAGGTMVACSKAEEKKEAQPAAAPATPSSTVPASVSSLPRWRAARGWRWTPPPVANDDAGLAELFTKVQFVIGVLLSDIALAMLDPRIRFTGGQTR